MDVHKLGLPSLVVVAVLTACGGGAAPVASSPAISATPSAAASKPVAASSVASASAKPAASSPAAGTASAAAKLSAAASAPAALVASGALKHLKVGTLPTLGNAPFIIADKRGYFKEEGLEIELVPFSAGSQVIPPLSTGQIDAANSVTPNAGLVNAAARDLPVRFVADDGSIHKGENIATILVRKELQPTAGQYVDFASLKKPVRVAATAAGLVPDAILKLQLQKAGVNLNDAQFNYLGLPDVNVALKNGNVDIAASGEPLITLAVQQGLATRWKPFDELYPGMPYSNLLYGPNLREKDKDAGERLLRAFLRGARDYQDAVTKNKDRDAIVAMLADPLKIPKDLFDAMAQQGGGAYFDPDGKVDVQALQPIVNFWIQNKEVQQPSFDAKSLVDPSFAAAAAAKLPKYQ